MRKSAEFDCLAAPEVDARRGVSRSSSTVISRREAAGNDASFEVPAPFVKQIEVWTQHALATNAMGDRATSGTASFRRPTSYQLHLAARANRSLALGGVIVAAIRALGAIVRRARAHFGG